ncbi:MAG: AlpA family transcriptional regulator [Terracidiphilus sp.]
MRGNPREYSRAHSSALDSSHSPHTPAQNAAVSSEAGRIRFLRLSEVRSRVPYSRATIYRLIAAGQFPRPYSLGARAVAWLESEIHTWIDSRVAANSESKGPGAQ